MICIHTDHVDQKTIAFASEAFCQIITNETFDVLTHGAPDFYRHAIAKNETAPTSCRAGPLSMRLCCNMNSRSHRSTDCDGFNVLAFRGSGTHSSNAVDKRLNIFFKLLFIK